LNKQEPDEVYIRLLIDAMQVQMIKITSFSDKLADESNATLYESILENEQEYMLTVIIKAVDWLSNKLVDEALACAISQQAAKGEKTADKLLKFLYDHKSTGEKTVGLPLLGLPKFDNTTSGWAPFLD
jgi:hypothetical protein